MSISSYTTSILDSSSSVPSPATPQVPPKPHQTLYMPITSPPTPAPSPGPINYPYRTPTAHSTALIPQDHHNYQPPTSFACLVTMPLQNPILRRRFLSSVLAACTPEELLFISAIIAPRLKRDFLSSLPPELALQVLSFVDEPRTLTRAAQVSKHWEVLSNDNSVWKRMCHMHGFDDYSEGTLKTIGSFQERRPNGVGKNRRRETRRDLHEASRVGLGLTDLPSTGLGENPLRSVLGELPGRMGQLVGFPLVEWFTNETEQAAKNDNGSTPTLPSLSFSSSAQTQHNYDRHHLHERHLSPDNRSPFSYRLHFKNSYITMTNWRNGGYLLRSHRMHISTPDSGVVTSLALDADWVIVGLANSRIQVYSARTGVLARTLVGHELGVWGVWLVTSGGWWEGAVNEQEEEAGTRGRPNRAEVDGEIRKKRQRGGQVCEAEKQRVKERKTWISDDPSPSNLPSRSSSAMGPTSTMTPLVVAIDINPDDSSWKPKSGKEPKFTSKLTSRQARKIRQMQTGVAGIDLDAKIESTTKKKGTPHVVEEPQSLEHLISPRMRVALGLDPLDDSDDSGSCSFSDGDDPSSSSEDCNREQGGFARYPDGVLNEDALEDEYAASAESPRNKNHRQNHNHPGRKHRRCTPSPSQDNPESAPFGRSSERDNGANISSGSYSTVCHSSRGWGQPNSIVVSGGCDKVIMVWDVNTGHNIYCLTGHTSTIRCIRVLNNRPIAVSGSRDATLRVWDVQRGKCLRVLEGHQQSVRCLDVCGNKVVSGSYDATCRLWDVDTGQCLHVLSGHFHQIYSVAFDGKHIASGGLDTTVRLWDAETGACIALLQGHTALVCQLQLSPTLLATGGSDGRVITFSLLTLDIQHRIAAHDSSVTSLQFDENFLVTGGNDGRVRLFDVKTGSYVREMSEVSEGVWKVGFGWGACVVLCRRGGKSVVEIWSMRPRGTEKGKERVETVKWVSE